MMNLPNNDLEWIELMLENSYRHNQYGELDDQIANLWVKYLEEYDETICI